MIDYSEFRQWIDALYQHPEWREELRRIVLTDEILELPALVREIAERVAELAAAQQRSEERLTRLESAVAELAKAQQRTEAWVRELAQAQRKLGKAVGALQTAVGATVEEEAASVVEVVLQRKGYRILKPAYSLPPDGEIDVVLPLEDPSGRKLWAVVEAKARLTYRDVRSWSQRMHEPLWHQKLAKKGIIGPYLTYAYGIRMDIGTEEAAKKNRRWVAQNRWRNPCTCVPDRNLILLKEGTKEC